MIGGPSGAVRAVAEIPMRRLAAPLAVLAAALAGGVGVMALATRGALARTDALLVPAAFLAVAAAIHGLSAQLVRATGRRAPPLHRRHGFWLVVAACTTTLPWLGTYGLVDPWETHYAEVARQILARDDAVSLFWAHDGWFLSKPVLLFWIEAASMRLLGVSSAPDGVLAGAGGAMVGRPEWALRAPVFALALVGSYVLYRGVARAAGRRAALTGALVLWTLPGWFFLAGQAITDGPMLAGVTAAIGLAIQALATPDDAIAASVRVRVRGRTFRVGAEHGLALAVVAVALPQIAWLASRNVTIAAAAPFVALHADALAFGSPGTCGMPGHLPCAPAALAHPRLAPLVQAAAWSLLLAVVLLAVLRERRAARVFGTGAALAAAVATMAKGPVGLVVPAAGVVAWALTAGRPRALLRFDVLTCAAVVVLAVLPWYVASWARLGRVFVDELVLRHMLGRTLEHLHDTNEGDDTSLRYFVWQLGYAVFPWVAVAPLALLRAMRARAPDRRGTARTVLALSALAAFTLASAMRTKFHHYADPALPGFAMLTGLELERLRARRTAAPSERLAVAGALACGLALTILVARDLIATTHGTAGPARLMQLFTYMYRRPWPDELAVLRLPIAAVALAALASTLGLAASSRALRRAAAAAAVTVALAFAAWSGASYLRATAPHWGQRGIVDAFYALRPDPTAPLAAYALNWKGENFYTGDRVAIFVAGGAPIRQWALGERARGAPFALVASEHDQVARLRADLAPDARATVVTSRTQSTKYCLVRVDFGREAPR